MFGTAESIDVSVARNLFSVISGHPLLACARYPITTTDHYLFRKRSKEMVV